jgi:hypothetical protein
VELLESRLNILQESLVTLVIRISKDLPVKHFVPADGDFTINNLVSLISAELAEGTRFPQPSQSSHFSYEDADESDESDESDRVPDCDEADNVGHKQRSVSNVVWTRPLPAALNRRTRQVTPPSSPSTDSSSSPNTLDDRHDIEMDGATAINSDNSSGSDTNSCTSNQHIHPHIFSQLHLGEHKSGAALAAAAVSGSFFLDSDRASPVSDLLECLSPFPVGTVSPQVLTGFDDSDVLESLDHASLDLSLNGKPHNRLAPSNGSSTRRLKSGRRHSGQQGESSCRVHKSGLGSPVFHSPNSWNNQKRFGPVSTVATMVNLYDSASSQYDNHQQHYPPSLFPNGDLVMSHRSGEDQNLFDVWLAPRMSNI